MSPKKVYLPEQIALRCSTKQREAWTAAADAAEMSVSDWIRETCDLRINAAPEETEAEPTAAPAPKRRTSKR